MELNIKSVSFGGYDKKGTEAYIAEMKDDYEVYADGVLCNDLAGIW